MDMDSSKKASHTGGLVEMMKGASAPLCKACTERGQGLVAIISTTAYLGLEARAVEVQCQIAAGMSKFTVVGLADKAVAESRERVHSALSALGLSLPPKRITVNLSPADLPKE